MRDLRLRIELEDSASCVSLFGAGGALLAEAASVIPTWPCTDLKLKRAILPRAVAQALEDIASREEVFLFADIPKELSDLPLERIGIKGVSWIRGLSKPGSFSRRGLRVLVVWSNPGSAEYPHLDLVEKEAEHVCAALADGQSRKISVVELSSANANAISRKIRSWKPHVLHFVGHADVGVLGGFLVVEAATGTHEKVHGEDLVRWLSDAGTQLVLLSGCRTSSVAMRLAEKGVPAALGMQAPVNDEQAFRFSQAFYADLALGEPIEIAMRRARRSLPAETQWIPLLATGDKPISPVAEAGRHTIPSDLRPFIGRTKERDELATYLIEHKVRLLTIHGMGGMGKTRLAKQVGLDVLDHYPDGVWFVECDTLTSEDHLVAAIAAAVSSEPSLGLEGICEDLADKKTLLVIDCFERIADLTDPLETILKSCSSVQMLVTSRIVLEGSTPYSLEPLADRRRSAPSERLALFEASVQYIDPAFRVTRANSKVCREVVRVLQGVPLAILLAAGRLRHYSLEELRDRLQQSLLEMLRKTGGKRDKHASLRIVITDSFELLPMEAQELAVKLSVFQGGFTQEDVRAVLPNYKDFENGISCLLDHALAVYDNRRYKTLDTVLEFTSGLMPEDTYHELHKRLTELVLKKAKCINAALNSNNFEKSISVLNTDISNIRSTISYCINHDKDSALRLGEYLAKALLEAGHRSELRLIGDYILRSLEDCDEPLQVHIIGLLASQQRRDGNLKECRQTQELLVSRLLSSEDKVTLADAIIDLTITNCRLGDYINAQKIMSLYFEIDPGALPSKYAVYSNIVNAQVYAGLGHGKESRGFLWSASVAFELEDEKRLPFYFMSAAATHRLLGDAQQCLRFAAQMLRIALDLGFQQAAGQAIIEGMLAIPNDLPELLEVAGRGAVSVPRAAATGTRKEALRLLRWRGISNVNRCKSEWPQAGEHVYQQFLLAAG